MNFLLNDLPHFYNCAKASAYHLRLVQELKENKCKMPIETESIHVVCVLTAPVTGRALASSPWASPFPETQQC